MLSFRDATDGQILSAPVAKAIAVQRAMRKGLYEGEVRRIIARLEKDETARETFEEFSAIEVFVR